MAETDEDELAHIEQGRKLFLRPCQFIAGAMTEDQLPPTHLPEVAFAGRSNVGKSSLINAITNQKSLARTSQTPGRTRQLNFLIVPDAYAWLICPDMDMPKRQKPISRRGQG